MLLTDYPDAGRPNGSSREPRDFRPGVVLSIFTSFQTLCYPSSKVLRWFGHLGSFGLVDSMMKNAMLNAARFLVICQTVIVPPLLLSAPALAEDEREPAVRTAAEREFVLGQMRLFLGSIQTILTAAAGGDMKTIATEAAARGRKGTPASSIPPTMKAKETAGWTSLMGGVRSGFDSVADAAASGATPQDITGRVGEVMRNCVACHQSYRLVQE